MWFGSKLRQASQWRSWPLSSAIAQLLLQLLLVTVVLDIPAGYSATVSFTANGYWAPATGDECEHYLCTPRNFNWQPDYPSRIYDSSSGCSALVEKGITHIYFHGDSYMRHIYAAALITLTGDYKYGSIADPAANDHCSYNTQFLEKFCSDLQLKARAAVCAGALELQYVQGLHPMQQLGECKYHRGSVVLWSFGNHKIIPWARQGVNDAVAYQRFFESGICPTLREKPFRFNGEWVNRTCSNWWIPTHYRYAANFPDEQPQVVQQFNAEMRRYFDTQSCGSVNYADVFNMTARLCQQRPVDAREMTYDGMHWGMEVNLVKAQIVFNALLAER